MSEDKAVEIVLKKRVPDGEDELRWRLRNAYEIGYRAGKNHAVTTIQNLLRYENTNQH